MGEYLLITGVSTGIGHASAKKFINAGYHVFGSVRKEADGAALKTAFGSRFTPLIFDVRDHTAIEKAKKRVETQLDGKGLAALINNAGVAVSGPMLHLDEEQWRYQFEVNVLGLIRTTKIFAPLLGAAKNSPYPPGKIINISSVAGMVTRPFMGPYASSKHAVEAISDALRRELDLYDIKVIVIQPGPIKTQIWPKAREEGLRFQDTDYAPIFKNQDKAIDGMEGIAIEVEKVADLIFKAFRSEHPKTRYFIAPKQWLFWLAAHVLPDKVLDNMFLKQIKKLKSGSRN